MYAVHENEHHFSLAGTILPLLFFSILCLCSTPPSTTRWDHSPLMFLCSTAYHSNSMELASTLSLLLSDPPQNLLGLTTSFPLFRHSTRRRSKHKGRRLRSGWQYIRRNVTRAKTTRRESPKAFFLEGAKPENRRAVRKKQGFPPLEIPPKDYKNSVTALAVRSRNSCSSTCPQIQNEPR